MRDENPWCWRSKSGSSAQGLGQGSALSGWSMEKLVVAGYGA